MFLKLFSNAMIKNIKIYNIIDITKISKYVEPNNDILKKLDENVHLNVFNDFSKFDGCRKIKV
jgi:hypothetical protein